MIIVKLNGGLGNQMFQYAYGRSISQKSGSELKLDISGYYKKNYLALKDDTKRDFLLEKFNIHNDIASEDEISALNPLWLKVFKKFKNKIFGHRNSYAFYKRDMEVSESLYQEGFWQNEEYFRDISQILKKEITLKHGFGSKAENIKNQIQDIQNNQKLAIALHVRRGDYTRGAISGFDSCDIEYYKQALSLILKNASQDKVFFILSDDILWADQNIRPLINQEVVLISQEGVHDYEEMALMSLCDHFIIANSTFSWWGAWLGEKENSIIIAPQKWSRSELLPASPVPERWVQI